MGHLHTLARTLFFGRGDIMSLFSELLQTDERVSMNVDRAFRYAVEAAGGSQKAAGAYGHLLTIGNDMEVHFDCEWPLNALVFHEGAMRRYRDIFRFLVRMVRARYMLNSAQLTHIFGPVVSMDAKVVLLRAKLAAFMNALQDYVMTRVIASARAEYFPRMEAATTVDELRKAHHMFLDEIYDRCMLTTRMEPVLSQVEEYFRLCHRFPDAFKAIVDDETDRFAAITVVELDQAATRITIALYKLLVRATGNQYMESHLGDLKLRIDFSGFWSRRLFVDDEQH